MTNFAVRTEGGSPGGHRQTNAVIAQSVEHQLPKLRVASSSLVYRSTLKAVDSQLNMNVSGFPFEVLLTPCKSKKRPNSGIFGRKSAQNGVMFAHDFPE